VPDVTVIGAGPYGLATAKALRDRGLSVAVYGKPMGFWRDHMPPGMLLRSGPDWHMDPAGELTFHAFCPDPPAPIPLSLYLDYADWFQAQAGIEPIEAELTALPDGPVVAAPGVAYFQHRPEWATDEVHTCDYVDFADVSGAELLIVGGRQSAYETAALALEHGAARVDVVHRHPQPRFAEASWAFVDEHVQRTLDVPGYWRRLPASEQAAIARRFWEVGRLTLEPWLSARIKPVHVHAGSEVVRVDGEVELSDGTRLRPDRIVLATGYKADLSRVPYLPELATEALDEHMQSVARPGLFLPGFVATADFGPFFGFVKGAPAAATLIARAIVHANG
jgi:cation diffusion facilitator CzcD-associated flavoprotein CzcO